MRRQILFGMLALTLASCACQSGSSEKARTDIAGHVIVIGLDGWGTWSFEKGDTPFIREMMKEGSYTLYKRTVLPSISGANWAAMMNGTPAESSGIIGNNAAPYFKPLARTEHNAQPTFFHLLKQARPGAETGVVCEWGDFLNYADTLCLDHFERIQDPTGHPDAIVEESVEYIKEKKPALCFIHIDALDHAGHAYGQGSAEYYAELPRVDDRVRRIVEGVREAGRKTTVIPTVLTTAPGVLKEIRGSEEERMATETGLTISYICPLMYCDNPLVHSVPIITNSNKLRTYTSCRFYEDGQILSMITGRGRDNA